MTETWCGARNDALIMTLARVHPLLCVHYGAPETFPRVSVHLSGTGGEVQEGRNWGSGRLVYDT